MKKGNDEELVFKRIGRKSRLIKPHLIKNDQTPIMRKI